MFCTKCGQNLSDNVRFCIHCGAPVKPVGDLAEGTQNANYGGVNEAPVNSVEPMNVASPIIQERDSLPSKGAGITSMIFGFCAWIPILGIILGIISIILGIVAQSKAGRVGRKNGFATAGIVLSSIAVVIYLIIIWLGIYGWMLSTNI